MLKFIPSQHGFKFENNFPDEPAVTIKLPFVGTIGIGNAANGLCGGMVYAAKDLFLAYKAVPDSTDPPDKDTPLFKMLVNRLLDSFDIPWGLAKFYEWMAISDDKLLFDWTVAWLGKTREFQYPIPLGVILTRSKNPTSLASQHQVLATYAEDRYGIIDVQIYDPNYPSRDDIFLKLDRSTKVIKHTGNNSIVRGFFATKYNYVAP